MADGGLVVRMVMDWPVCMRNWRERAQTSGFNGYLDGTGTFYVCFIISRGVWERGQDASMVLWSLILGWFVDFFSGWDSFFRVRYI